MSLLDRQFKLTSARGLPVQQERVAGESTLEPGILYLLLGERLSEGASAIVAIAAHRVADVVGKRIGIKIVEYDPPPIGMPLHVVTPDGQLIEGYNGEIASFIDLGTQEIGSYHEWICDPDGNWLLISRPPGGEAAVLGQIVVQGIPVVVQGVPLVRTPPVAALAKPEPVVHVARIVPRALPRAATVELRDTFADGSLEMTPAGDLFRVGADVREPFPLRVVSVSGTTYEELAVLRFDATPFGGAVTLIAELEVSAAGQVAELQLFNLTAGAAVTTLTTGSTTTARVSAALTLPASEALYSLRLRRVGGDVAQLVSCRSAVLEATRS